MGALTLFTPDTCFGVLFDEQGRSRSDNTKCGITSGSTLFSYRISMENAVKNDNIHQRPLTHSFWKTSKRVIGKQYRPRSDTT